MQPNNRISQRNYERLRADDRFGTENGVAQTELPPLAGVEILQILTLESQFGQEILLSRLAEGIHQLGIDVEVVLDGRLARPRNEKQASDPAATQFLNHMLDYRLAPHREHLLGLTLS